MHDTAEFEPKPLRVLFINDTSRSGGPGRTIFYILKFLNPGKIHRTVVIPREGVVSDRIRRGGGAESIVLEPGLVENPAEPFSRLIERTDFEASFAVTTGRFLGNVVRALLGLLRLRHRVRTEAVDLIFCNGTTSSFVGGVLAKLTGVPTIWHVLYSSVPPLVRPLHAYLAKEDNIRSIVCVSRATARQFDHCKNKVMLNHTGLDIGEFDPRAVAPCLRSEFNLEPEIFIFGSHGRIVPKKGYLEMIRAARLFFDEMGADARLNCRFVVVGDTPQDTRRNHLDECIELVGELGLNDVFHFIGHRSDVRPYLRDFDVAVVPSIYDDPLPRGVMESMALAKPVIAFDVGGISEMIVDGDCGLLICATPPDINGMARAFKYYFCDAELCARQGQAARQRIETEFSAQEQAAFIEREIVRVALPS